MKIGCVGCVRMNSQVQEMGFNTFFKDFNISPNEILHTYEAQNKRHHIIKFTNGLKIVLLTKKEPFYNFGRIFENEEGWGESINKEALERYIKLGIKYILIRYLENKYTYFIKPIEWLGKAYIRETNGSEITLSIGMKNLKRLETIKDLME